MRWKYKDPKEWHTAFAWFPVLCNDKTVVWLERYERQYVGFRYYRCRPLPKRKVRYDRTDYGD